MNETIDAKHASHSVYSPIAPYQTRIIRLHGDESAFNNSPIICDLCTADLLHAKFEGLGLRAPSGGRDDLIEYDALSYAWGFNAAPEVILCNGVQFPVTQNLFGALRALRPRQRGVRHLWVDAICINQLDLEEKATQVFNMLQIYQKATTVIAWLGAVHPDLGSVLAAEPESDVDTATSRTVHVESLTLADVRSVFRGLADLYSRPWFQRIWVQQEIFAARQLIFQCGHYRFRWAGLLSDPRRFFYHPYRGVFIRTGFGNDIAGANTIISDLVKLHSSSLNCFERFSTSMHVKPDIITALVYTGTLQATNPKDYIYGILGMAEFPTVAMSFSEWIKARKQRLFIPIDYAADLAAIMTAVTWTLIMKVGLSVLAKFQVFTEETHGPKPLGEYQLPSWVIDWRIVARCFTMPDRPDNRLDNSWDNRLKQGMHGNKLNGGRRMPESSTPEHTEACKENGPLNWRKIVVRGFVHPGFYAKDRCVWEKRRVFNDRAIFGLETDVHHNDIVVHIDTLQGGECGCYQATDGSNSRRGLWLLRPIGNNQFRLIAFLSWTISTYPYDYWKWTAEDAHQEQQPLTALRRLFVPLNNVVRPSGGRVPFMKLADDVRNNLQLFTIV